MSGHRSRRHSAALFLGAWLAGCAPLTRRVPDPLWNPELAAPGLAADQLTVDTIARGVVYRAFVIRRVPWAIHVLDVDRDACWTAAVVKGGAGVEGRQPVSELVRRSAVRGLATGRGGRPTPPRGRPPVAGGVNGDFFLFEPPGVPVAAHIEDGRVIAGPSERPVFAIDSAGRPWLGALRVEGQAASGAESIEVSAWNRHPRAGVAFFDRAYGARVDSASGSIRVVLDGERGGAVLSIDSSGTATPIPTMGSVLEASRDAPTALRARLVLLARARARFAVTVRLAPFHPRQAVGGNPVLVRDSAEVAGLDSAGASTFAAARHPRTIIGIAAGGRRLMLVAVDGRRDGHSAGMTLREAAALARDLGASQAINLDGGGSTAMVIARRGGGGYRYGVVNRPSDAAGERAVGNALAVLSSCGG
jgi:hypothetical protein